MKRRFLAIAVFSIFLGSCATDWVGKARLRFREPGERIVAMPEEIWEEYGCGERQLPYLRVEHVELLPRRLEAGAMFNHRIVYSLCPIEPTAVVAGTLDTVILHRGRPIVRDEDANFELKPGRWVIDSFVSIPRQAAAGIYAVELAFRGGDLSFEERRSFAIESKRPQAARSEP